MQKSARPGIVLVHASDPNFIREASKRGILPTSTDADLEDGFHLVDQRERFL